HTHTSTSAGVHKITNRIARAAVGGEGACARTARDVAVCACVCVCMCVCVCYLGKMGRHFQRECRSDPSTLHTPIRHSNKTQQRTQKPGHKRTNEQTN